LYITDHTYYEEHRVHTHNCDTFLSARLPYYFQLVQEGAASHAMLCGCSNPDFEKIGKAWILSKIKMTVHRYLPWSEQIGLQTWIQSPVKLFAPREARGTDKDGRELFRTMAYWVVIDRHTRRPERPLQFLDYIGLSEDRHLWADTKLGKIEDLPSDRTPEAFTPQIQYRDIDSVRHVNNISYVEWILESIDPEYRDTWKPSEFEINFLAESFLSDQLEVRSCQLTDSQWLHSVVRTTHEGEVETCRARSSWSPREALG